MNNTHASRTRYLVELALMVTIIFVMAFPRWDISDTWIIHYVSDGIRSGWRAMMSWTDRRCDLWSGIRYHQFMHVLRMGAFEPCLFSINHWEQQ